MKILMGIILGLGLVSCASFKDVKVLDSKPGNNCEIINKIVGVNDFGSEKAAIKDLRCKAAKKGANAVFVEEIVPNGKKIEAHGPIYKCD